MEEESLEEEWSDKDLPEGFDVYNYDARRARAGQFMVLAIFAIAVMLFALATYSSYRDAVHSQEERPASFRNVK